MRGSVCHPIEERKKQKICCACGRYDTAVNPGDVVNIIGQFDSEGVCHITDLTHFIVIDPDRLLSGTSIVSSVHCMRRFIFFPFLLPFYFLDSTDLYLIVRGILIIIIRSRNTVHWKTSTSSSPLLWSLLAP